jgi:hypothetical protein
VSEPLQKTSLPYIPPLTPETGSSHPNTAGVQIGDVLAIHGTTLADKMIELGSSLIGEPNLASHIAVLHHQDANGTWWVLEGRPGGVGWRDATAYLNSSYTITNRNQPRTIEQRTEICYWMAKLINTQYDWDAIVNDGLRDLHLVTMPDPWGIKDINGEVSGHIVCSSAATFAHVMAKCLHPEYASMTDTEPSDWVKFILDNNYA